MLTGRVPFQAAGETEMIHAHIARIPLAPFVVDPGIPRALSDIVMKLLAKSPDERYHSARGLQADLNTWLDGAAGPAFVPGSRDVADEIRIPEKLYGRARELDVLKQSFDRVCGGAADLLLVAGYSGVGKSSLVRAMRRPVAARGGYFVSGKFDQLESNIPHSAIVSAFQELVRKLLTEGDDELAAWRERLAEALGANGQVIVQVIPEVELIVGPQPPIPTLAPAEATNRFYLVFRRFIEVFAQEAHPLVLFLDDLQWADAATLRMLQILLENPDFHHLLVIGAYRDNEVGPEHLSALIADSLRCSPQQAAPVADLIREQTGGNPFFVIQLITAIHSEGLLAYDAVAWRLELRPARHSPAGNHGQRGRPHAAQDPPASGGDAERPRALRLHRPTLRPANPVRRRRGLAGAGRRRAARGAARRAGPAALGGECTPCRCGWLVHWRGSEGHRLSLFA